MFGGHVLYPHCLSEKLGFTLVRPPDSGLSRVRHAAERQHAAVRAAAGHRHRRAPARALRGPPRHWARHASRASTSRRRGLPRARSPRVAAPAGAGSRGRVGAGVVGGASGPTVRHPTASGAASSCGAMCAISLSGPARCPASPARTSAAVLETLLGDVRLVYVTRADKVAQAVSLWRAVQTQSWRSGPHDTTTIDCVAYVYRGHRPPPAPARGRTTPPGGGGSRRTGATGRRGVLRGPRARTRARRPPRCSRSSDCRPTVCPSRDMRRQGDDALGRPGPSATAPSAGARA